MKVYTIKLFCKYTNLRSILIKKDEMGILMKDGYFQNNRKLVS